jgi:phosphate transport system substrate-binding protein
MRKLIALAVLGIAVVAASATAGVSALSGTITADGSSTVGPYTTAAAEGFQKKNKGARVTVGISGTGGGFERFCRNETDLSNASRPMKASEAVKCADAGVKYVAFTVANDGLSLVVNKQNTWASCLTVTELKKIWEPGSKINNWKDVRSGFPDVPLKLFGAGTDSGTFDYFTEAINGKAKASRSDYLATEDDNITVQGVEGERGALGYFGYSYYAENKDKLKVVAVNQEKGLGCIAPSIATVQGNKYKPLSRPLFIYAKRTAFKRPVVAGFIGYIFNNEKAIAKQSRFISLTDRQLKKARYQYTQALKSNNQ